MRRVLISITFNINIKIGKILHKVKDMEKLMSKKLTVVDTTDIRHANATANDGPKYKFGELFPQNACHAMYIVRTNGNTGW
jgi:hypothetical protein